MSRLHAKNMKRTKTRFSEIMIWIARIAFVLAIIWFIWAQNNLVVNRRYVYTAADLPKSFVGYKIVHISDICNSNKDITSIVKNSNPDIIVISGGYSDNKGNSQNTIKLINKLANIAPVYYIYNIEDNGNELSNSNATNIIDTTITLNTKLVDAQTFIKENYGDKIIKKANEGDEEAKEYIDFINQELAEAYNSYITLSGIGLYNIDNGTDYVLDKAWELIGTDSTELNILVNGNINNTKQICKSDTDILLCGNTFGTNYSSSDYKKGLYGQQATTIFVSGGVGGHDGVTRILNFPEIQTIILSDGTITQDNPLEEFIKIFYKDVGNIFENDGGFKEYRQTFSTQNQY